jgi:hypothetical protein
MCTHLSQNKTGDCGAVGARSALTAVFNSYYQNKYICRSA